MKRILIDDFTEKVGVGNRGREDIMGKEALREINENDGISIDFCVFNDLCFGGCGAFGDQSESYFGDSKGCRSKTWLTRCLGLFYGSTLKITKLTVYTNLYS